LMVVIFKIVDHLLEICTFVHRDDGVFNVS